MTYLTLVLVTLLYGSLAQASELQTIYQPMPNVSSESEKIIVAVFEMPRNVYTQLKLIDSKSISVKKFSNHSSLEWSFGPFRVDIRKDNNPNTFTSFQLKLYRMNNLKKEFIRSKSLPSIRNTKTAFIIKGQYVFFMGLTPYDQSSFVGFLPEPLGPNPFEFSASTLLISGHHMDLYDPKQVTKEKTESIEEHFRNEELPILAFFSQNKLYYRRFIEPKLASHWYRESGSGRFQAIFNTKETKLAVVLTGGYFRKCLQNSLWSTLLSVSQNPQIQTVVVKIPLEAVYAEDESSLIENGVPYPHKYEYNSLSHYYQNNPETFNTIFNSFKNKFERKQKDYASTMQLFTTESSQVVHNDPILGSYIEFNFEKGLSF